VYAGLLNDLDRNYFRFSGANVTVIFTISWLILIDCPELPEQTVLAKIVSDGRNRPLFVVSLSKFAVHIAIIQPVCSQACRSSMPMFGGGGNFFGKVRLQKYVYTEINHSCFGTVS
jgi:hypothetical protein